MTKPFDFSSLCQVATTMVVLALCSATAAVRAQQIYEEGIGPQIVPPGSPMVSTASFLVPLAEQRALGLVTITRAASAVSVGGTCSGTLLNRHWVLTAHHCISQTTVPMPPAQARILLPTVPANLITVSATWSTVTATATRLETFSNAARIADWSDRTGQDIALVFLGSGDLGPVETDWYHRLWDGTWSRGIQGNSNLDVYGRGRSQWARRDAETNAPIASVADGRYRVQRSLSAAGPSDWYFWTSAIIAGGDSGGPTLIEIQTNTGPRRYIVGVHSFCPGGPEYLRYLAGQPRDWDWITFASCADQAVLPVVERIQTFLGEVPPGSVPVGRFPEIPPEVVARTRALYAASIDEPLMAPPNAAIDVTLTFERCHGRFVAGRGGCPVGPQYEMWSYNPMTRQLLHVPSAKCVNISGARTDAGSPIILYPCSNAPNEKWTINTATSNWTIKSDLTGMCLHAKLGQSGRGLSLGTPATLVQMPCDGSKAQLFSDVDSSWRGPH